VIGSRSVQLCTIERDQSHAAQRLSDCRGSWNGEGGPHSPFMTRLGPIHVSRHAREVPWRAVEMRLLHRAPMWPAISSAAPGSRHGRAGLRPEVVGDAVAPGAQRDRRGRAAGDHDSCARIRKPTLRVRPEVAPRGACKVLPFSRVSGFLIF
jgi:hypothetical protein